jgi:predicted XRE-type DNA-binding protein
MLGALRGTFCTSSSRGWNPQTGSQWQALAKEYLKSGYTRALNIVSFTSRSSAREFTFFTPFRRKREQRQRAISIWQSDGSNSWPGNAAVNETRDKGRWLMKEKITRSSVNIFEDLGFPSEQAEYLKIRSTLMIHLRKTIEAKGMKQAEAAKLLGVTQPRVSDLYKGKIHLFSIDTLVDMLSRVGVHVKLVVGSSKRKLKVA